MVIRRNLKKIIIKKKVDSRILRHALNTPNAAVFMGISEALLRKMREEGNGPRYSRVNSRIVYIIDDLKDFLEKNRV